MSSFLKRHWKKAAGVVVAAVGVFVPGLQPLIPIGGMLFGSDFQIGASAGTPLGKAAKDAQRSLKK
jgi:hypothetical protein